MINHWFSIKFTSHPSFQTKDWAAFPKLNVILLARVVYQTFMDRNLECASRRAGTKGRIHLNKLADCKVRHVGWDLCLYSLLQPVNKSLTVSSTPHLLQDRTNWPFKMYSFPQTVAKSTIRDKPSISSVASNTSFASFILFCPNSLEITDISVLCILWF